MDTEQKDDVRLGHKLSLAAAMDVTLKGDTGKGNRKKKDIQNDKKMLQDKILTLWCHRSELTTCPVLGFLWA